MIDYSIEISGTVLEKKKYHMTEEGKTEFLKWEKSIHPGKAVTKDEFRLQLFFSDALEKKENFCCWKNSCQFHRQYLDDLHEKETLRLCTAFRQCPVERLHGDKGSCLP